MRSSRVFHRFLWLSILVSITAFELRAANAQHKPALREIDRVRLAEAFKSGGPYWPPTVATLDGSCALVFPLADLTLPRLKTAIDFARQKTVAFTNHPPLSFNISSNKGSATNHTIPLPCDYRVSKDINRSTLMPSGRKISCQR